MRRVLMVAAVGIALWRVTQPTPEEEWQRAMDGLIRHILELGEQE